MSMIVHISDTHFGTEVPAVTDAALRCIRALRPEVVILSGDVTQRARAEEFRAAQNFLAELGTETLVIPGNHDIPLDRPLQRLFSPYAEYRRTFGERECFWQGQRAAIVGLDATSPLRHTRGAVGLDHLSVTIEAARQKLASDAILIVAIHQPLHTAWDEDRKEVLIDSRDIACVLSRLGADVVLSGHVHVPLATTSRAVNSALSRHFILAGAGTVVSRRTRSGTPNSFNTIQVGDGATPDIVLTRFDFDAASGEFQGADPLRFRQTNEGWV
jgi:3',5'-cyclic AMP phosphodiesterase CpdA